LALPGNRMTFPGLADPNARRDVIAYLKIESSK
jgi:cytochrome c2